MPHADTIQYSIFKLTVASAALLALFAADNSRSIEAKEKPDLDSQLLALLLQHEVTPIDIPDHENNLVQLGQALFFDRILSGNRDIACATCHHPLLATGDGLAFPVGTGTPTIGALGFFREKGDGREFVPRNAPEVFNRGSVHWTSQFWDSRIEVSNGVLLTPAGADLPSGLSTVLAAQAMFPVTSRDEMRGSLTDVLSGNELAAIPDQNLPAMWEALMIRLLSTDGYPQLFSEAYPNIPEKDLGFEHAATAIAAFEAEAFGYDDSPFDNYLRGDNEALDDTQKRGAILFYGKANCASCHAGTLLTDQKHYNLGIPQLGPGKDPATGLDFGRFGITGDPNDLFRFRTPPLRNVTATGPWMHNGAYSDLRDAVKHHLDAVKYLHIYQPQKQLDQPELWETVVDDEETNDLLTEDLDLSPSRLNGRELKDLMAFLESLTAPHLHNRLFLTIPSSVPSGLLEDGIPE
ncbi:MAG: cytochrome-c peroxidase [Planctomycetaceae bacterium]|nr:cytochrome-c peroxidase [Planctomycetaceae bacterium]